MTLTRAFKETIMKRATRDKAYRRGLLSEAVNEILEGNINVGKALLRNYINATITFPTLARKLHKSSKSIQRMLVPKGNPRMDSIVGVLKVLQTQEKIRLHTKYFG
jgi:DNA-binding phage protein